MPGNETGRPVQLFGRGRFDESQKGVAADDRGVTVGMQAPGVFSADISADMSGNLITETLAFTNRGQAAAPQMPTGLASLDVEMPQMGQSTVYLFTTPQGDVEISARALANDKLTAAVRLLLALAATLAFDAARGLWIHGSFVAVNGGLLAYAVHRYAGVRESWGSAKVADSHGDECGDAAAELDAA